MPEGPQIITVGYTGASMPVLVRMVRQVNGLLIDTRYQPHSMAPVWRKPSFYEHFGAVGTPHQRRDLEPARTPAGDAWVEDIGRYVHIQEFGNENYKGGPIKLKDFDRGLHRLMQLLAEQPVQALVFMCGCPEYRGCHRTVVATQVREFLETHLGETVSLLHWPTEAVMSEKQRAAVERKTLHKAAGQRGHTSMDPELDNAANKRKGIGKRFMPPGSDDQISWLDMATEGEGQEPRK